MQRRRKAVSPVIAIVLIIALVAATVGTVWVLIQTFNGDNIETTVELDIEGYYDFDGNGRAELAIVKLTPKLNSIALNVSGATVNIENSTYIGSSWGLLGSSSKIINAFESGYFFVYTDDSSEELIVGQTYTVKVTLVAEVTLTFTVSEVKAVDPLTLEIFSSGSSTGLMVNGAEVIPQLTPEEIELLASQTPLGSVRVVLYNQRTGFPVANMDKNTASDGKVSFRVRPGQYFVKIFVGSKTFSFGPFFHPSSVDSIGKVKRINVEDVFSPVTVTYSEQSVPIEGATIAVREKVTIGGTVYEKVTASNKLTDANGSATYVLRNGEYKFLAYSGSTVPAPSDWVDTSVQKNVNINVEPGIVYVKVSTSSGSVVKNARVSAYGVISGKNTYLTYGYTNDSGIVRFSITSSNFLIKVTQGAIYTSSVFKVVAGKTYEYIIQGNDLTVNLKSQDGTTVPNIYTYLYNGYGQYYASGRSDSDGQVKYTGLSNGTYYLKYYQGSSLKQTSQFTISGSLVYNITLTGIPMYVNVSSGGQPRVNQYVYAYSSSGSYLGWGRTNGTGVAVFLFPSNASAYFRASAYVYNVGYTSFQTPQFIPSSGLLVNLKLDGTRVTVNVQDQNSNPLYRQYVTVYDSNNQSLQSSYTNTNGQVVFLLQDGTNYSVSSGDVFSSQFNTSVTTSISLTVYVVSFTIHALAADGSNLANAYIYLYANISNAWRYSGYVRADANGQGTFTAANSTNYRVYVYGGGVRLYSNAFTISEGKVITVQPSTFTVEVNLPDGPYANRYVYLYTPENNYVTYAYTDSNGNATFSIIDGSTYKLYIPTARYYSNVFSATNGGFLRLTINLPQIQLQVKTSAGDNYTPSSTWEYVYVYFANGSYAGYSYLNSTGAASYYLVDGEKYYFRMYKAGREILSSNFTAADGLIETLIVTGNQVSVTVRFDGSTVANAYVYLYDAVTRRYMGYGRTNSTGVVVFDGVLNGTFYAYVSSSSIRQTSSDFTVIGDTNYGFNITTTTLTVTLYQVDSTSLIGSGQRVYVRTLDGYYSGYQTSDASGQVTFTVADNSSYYVYSYYSAQASYVYSDIIDINGTTTATVRPVSIYISVKDSGSNPVQGMRVFLQREGIAMGYGVSNSTGTATIYGNNGTSYFYSAAKYSLSYGYSYSNFTAITATTGVVGSLNIGGGDVQITVVDSSGNPAANVYVYLYKPVGSSYQWTGYYGRTDSNGVLTLSGVGEGTYVAYSYGVYSSQFLVNSALTTVTITL